MMEMKSVSVVKMDLDGISEGNCAYDTVTWKFLKKLLRNLGCFTLYVNGERIVYFKGGRGLRQGDHIERDPKFQYHFGCKTMKLVHVCFSDDLLVMCHGDFDSVKVIKSALDEFTTCCGLLPNNSKSTVFFGSLCEEDRQAILNILPFAIGKLPNKVKNWKNKSLSYARRLQLIAVVLESIHVYSASVFLLPITVINEINKLLKGFLWNQGETAKGKAKVAWINLCRPKDQDLYDTRLKEDLALRDMITNGQWNWPEELYEKFPMVTQIACPTLNDETTDKIVDIWRKVSGIADIDHNGYDLKKIIQSLINAGNGNNIRDAKRNCEEVFKCIMEVIKHTLLGITVKDSKAVRDVKDKWKYAGHTLESSSYLSAGEDSVLRVFLGFTEYTIIGGKGGSIMEVCVPRIVMPYPLSPSYSVNGMAGPLLMMHDLPFHKSLWWQATPGYFASQLDFLLCLINGLLYLSFGVVSELSLPLVIFSLYIFISDKNFRDV
nr:hypothetical protein [Tanacetum cinerariifolium]